MKTPYKLLSTAFISTFIIGCSSTSIQNVAKPDINQPINENETIIQLKRADYLRAGGLHSFVTANGKSIGELANGDELIWKTSSNSLECITVGFKSNFADTLMIHVKLDDTPAAYKCFNTKPKEIMTLTYDFNYPESGVAFMPVFKLSPTFDKSAKVTVRVTSSISTEVQGEKDTKTSLENAIKDRFKSSLTSSSSKTVDIEILEYKTGNAATRWIMESMKGSTLVKVKVIIKEGGQVVETFITRPVVSSGGLLSVGADEYIFDEVAEDIYLHLFGGVS